jgi:ketosteroid isomerase-like protein
MLDERHSAIRADAPGIAERGFTRERDAFARGDWDEVVRCFAPDFVTIDRRPLGFAPATAEEYLARSRELVASAPELHAFARKAYYAPRAVLAAVTFAGNSAEGSEYEWDLVMVARADDQGRYLRLEYFPEDQWTEALTQFDEWSS